MSTPPVQGRPGDAARTAAVDLRLVPGAVAAWGAAWCVPAVRPVVAWTFVGGCVVGATALSALCRGRTIRATAAVALVCCAAGGASATLQTSAQRAGPVRALADRGATVTAQLTVTGDPTVVVPKVRGTSLGTAKFRIPARVDRLVTPAGPSVRLRTPVLILATGQAPWPRLLPGTRINAAGRLVAARPDSPATALLIVESAPRVTGRPSDHQRLAGHVRDRLRRACAGLPAAPRGLLPGLVVGDTSAVPLGLTEDFRTTELTHLMAVSGTNITILLGAALLTFRHVGVRGRALPVLGAGAVVGFVVLARPEPSVLRAALMGLVTLAALFGGWRRHGPSALAAAALLLVLLDPALARSFGFILSVLATGALLLIAPRWAAALVRRGWPAPIAVVVAVPCAAQAVCAPVVVTFTERVSIVAVPCNLLAEFAVAPATVLGFVVLLVAPLHIPAAALVAHVAAVPVAWIALVARTGAAFPGATVGWPGGLPGGLALAVVTVAAIPLTRALVRRPVAVTVLAAVVLIALLRPQPLIRPLTGWPPPGWHLVACDVGQGDAFVLNAGHGRGVVVDTGPDPHAVDRCLRDLGIDRVPLVMLSHFHADHVEGLPGVLNGRAVGAVETSGLREPAGEVARVQRWAEAARVPVQTARHGEQRVVADGALRWRVIGPRDPQAVRRYRGSAPNNASTVVLAEVSGIRILFTGDVEPEAQRALRADLSGIRVDVLKVPHHGSARQDPALFLGLRPRLALVSVGAGNTYGHPSRAALSLLTAAGAHTARTDLQGAIALSGTAKDLRITTRPRSRVVARGGPPARHDHGHAAQSSALNRSALCGCLSPSSKSEGPQVQARVTTGRVPRSTAHRAVPPGERALSAEESPMFPRTMPPRRSAPRVRRRRLAAVAAAAAFALSATACGGGSDDGGSAGGTAQRGGSVTIPLPVESRGLDPFTASYTGSADSSRMAALYDFLVYLDPADGKVKPRVAESLIPDATGAVWTLKIKPNVNFSDGTPYDAAAVKANWDANNDPAMSSIHRANMAGVTSEVAGPLELRITLAKPNLNFDRTVANGLAHIASPTAFKADPKGFPSKPVGAGPFLLKEWVRGSQQVMVRNPTYWQAGLPMLDQITFTVMPDSTQLLNTLGNNQADITVTSNGEAEEIAATKNLEAITTQVYGGQYFLMNMRRAPFDDPRARRAMAMAFDGAAMMQTLYQGDIKTADGLFPDNSPLIDPSVSAQPAYNQAEAQKLFDELAAEGKPVNFTYLTQQNANARKTAEYMQSRLAQYKNVKMEVEALEVTAYITKGLVNRDFQAQNFGMWLADPDPGIDSLFRTGSPTNYSGYANPAADAALDQARAATTPEGRRAAYSELVKLTAQDVPLFVWQEATTSVIHRPSVTGLQVVNDGALVVDQIALKK
ncbi:ComEC/Rec2 family competence protein [Streptodolium elevatio]|uniref:ComEC/Rec2 family competence protein n=1 Tax=Streptodolium elevatio TaxID=3157996 RepID=A0ABV3DUM9_9ACTN